MQNLKRNNTNELIYKPESQTQRTNLWLQGLGVGGGLGEGIPRELKMDMCTPLHLEWRANKVLLFCARDAAQCYVTAWRGEEFGGE